MGIVTTQKNGVKAGGQRLCKHFAYSTRGPLERAHSATMCLRLPGHQNNSITRDVLFSRRHYQELAVELTTLLLSGRHGKIDRLPLQSKTTIMFVVISENNMKSIFPSAYEIKKTLLWPRTLLMRWKYRKTSGPMKAMMELHYYRPAFFDFVGATYVNKHVLHDVDISSDSVVVDVGAFTGGWAQHMVDRYDPIIYAFEPNPKSLAALHEKAASNPKLHPMPYGLGDEDLTVDFTLNGLGSSMCDERTDHSDLQRIKVEIAAIDRVWKDLNLGRVDLIKINIEGAEFPLLDKMIKTDLIKEVDCFLIQFHEWHPGAYRKRRRIQAELSKTHRLEWDYHFIWEKWVRI